MAGLLLPKLKKFGVLLHEQAKLGKLENASLISEDLKATDIESMLEENIHQSEAREHIMNENFQNHNSQKRQQPDTQADIKAALTAARIKAALLPRIHRQATRPLRDHNYALFVCTGYRLWRDIKQTFDQLSDDQKLCNVLGTPLTGDLWRRVNNLNLPCYNLTFFRAVTAKALSLPFLMIRTHNDLFAKLVT